MDDDDLENAVGGMLSQRFKKDDDDDTEPEERGSETNDSAEAETDVVEADTEVTKPADVQEDSEDAAGDGVEEAEIPADVPVREWDQYVMLLPPTIAEALNKRFKRLNAERTLDDKEELAKNEDYNLAMARFLLAEMDDEDILRYSGRE